MKGDDRHFSDVIDTGVGPRARGQIRYCAHVEVVAERGLGGFSCFGELTREREDDLVDEFRARQPVQVSDSPQYRWRQRLVVIYEAADGGALERIIT